MRSVGLVVISVGLLVALVATGAAIAFAVRDARTTAAIETTLAFDLPPENALAALTSIASVKAHRPNGQVVLDYARFPENPPLRGVAGKLFPPEVTCSGVDVNICVETSPAPLARRLRGILIAGAIGIGTAILFGPLASLLLARAMAAPLRRIADVVHKAAQERAYSLRVAPASGDLGRVSSSINELLAEIQERDVAIRRRTIELEAANKELESFAYSVSHDLRAPLGSIDGFTQALEADYNHLFDETAKEYISWVRQGCHQMRELIDGLLQMSRLAREEVKREPVDLSAIAQSVADTLQQATPDRPVKFEIREGVRTIGDERLLRAVLENLMANAFKFTRNRKEARIEFGMRDGAYFVRDNGAGFDPSHAAKMFRPFQRLHSSREFEGTGIGLATVQKIIERHGGRAWAEGEVEKGATIWFTTSTEALARA
jgi:signal transduction histidine kinase